MVSPEDFTGKTPGQVSPQVSPADISGDLWLLEKVLLAGSIGLIRIKRSHRRYRGQLMEMSRPGPQQAAIGYYL